MSRIVPILFNTDMVRAILEDRKRVTRRVVKQSVWENFVCEGGKVIHYLDKKTDALESPVFKAPYHLGDILYVRETWSVIPCIECKANDSCGKIPYHFEDKDTESECCYIYRAGFPEYADPKRITWRPSIHMPMQAARIWLRVTNLQVERLQDISLDGCRREGIDISRSGIFIRFSMLWNSTIRKSDYNLYSWDADPWVWVIEFERCEKPEW